MGLFKTKVRHQPMRAADANRLAFGATNEGAAEWIAWVPKFSLAGERGDCFVAQLVAVNGVPHVVLDGVDYGPVSASATDAMPAIEQYGGASCPAVLRITKPNATTYQVSVRRLD